MINNNIKIEIIQEYKNGYSAPAISKKYNIDEYLIYKTLKENGIKLRDTHKRNRTYRLNTNYFDEINTNEKAYWLGLLMADGYVGKNNNMVGISLQARDDHLLINMKKALDYNGRILDIHFKQKNWQNQKCLKFYSKELKEALCKLGCESCKSKTLLFPPIDTKFYKSFIRGYFDGDGSISMSFLRKRDCYLQTTVSIISSNIFIQKLCAIVESTLNIHMSIIAHKRCKEVSSMSVSGTKQILRFLDWIYDDDGPKLRRKYRRYLCIKRYKRLKKAKYSNEQIMNLFLKHNI